MNAATRSGSGSAAQMPYSFDLDDHMLRLLREEFDPVKLAETLAVSIGGKQGGALEEIGERVFSEYGRELMKRSIKLGEEYPDRTYEVLKEAVQQTGQWFFPLVPQRFLEIAYLATQRFSALPVVENLRRRLVYRIDDCAVFKATGERCGRKAADLMLCSHACLGALNALCQGLNLNASAIMPARMNREGFCEFVLGIEN